MTEQKEQDYVNEFFNHFAWQYLRNETRDRMGKGEDLPAGVWNFRTWVILNAREMIEGLFDQVKKTEQALSDKVKSYNQLNINYDNCEEALAGKDDKIVELTDQVTGLQEELSGARDQHAILQEQFIKSTVVFADQMAGKTLTLVRAPSVEQRHFEALEGELRAQVSRAKDEEKNARYSATDSHEKMLEANARNEELHKEIDKLRAKLIETEVQRDRHLEDTEAATKEIQRLQTSRASANGERDEALVENKGLADERDKFKDKWAEVQDDLDKCYSENKGLADERDKAQAERDSALRDVAVLRRQQSTIAGCLPVQTLRDVLHTLDIRDEEL